MDFSAVKMQSVELLCTVLRTILNSDPSHFAWVICKALCYRQFNFTCVLMPNFRLLPKLIALSALSKWRAVSDSEVDEQMERRCSRSVDKCTKPRMWEEKKISFSRLINVKSFFQNSILNGLHCHPHHAPAGNPLKLQAAFPHCCLKTSPPPPPPTEWCKHQSQVITWENKMI